MVGFFHRFWLKRKNGENDIVVDWKIVCLNVDNGFMSFGFEGKKGLFVVHSLWVGVQTLHNHFRLQKERFTSLCFY
jgi:hypothetical protein